MIKQVLASLALGATAVLATSAQSPEPPMRKAPLQIRLLPQNGSGETGTATLLDGANGLIVKLRLANTTADVQPAHIHKGTCDKLDPKPTYPLTTVRNGMSETTIKDVTLAQLEKAPFAINVHKSTTEIPTYVACGNIAAPK